MKPDTYREHLNDLQLEVEALRAKLKASQTGDTISRQAAIDTLNKHSVMFEYHLPHEFYKVKKEIRELPSAQPEHSHLDETETTVKILSTLRSQYNCFDESEEPFYRALSEAIEAINAQPEQRWIPVTERLPEEKKDVLAVDDEGFFYIAQYEVYSGKRYWIETTEYLSIDAVAWQPLPEPYKEEH